MKRRGKAARFGVVSMCIGSGMGAAAVFERGGEVDDAPRRPVGSQLTGACLLCWLAGSCGPGRFQSVP